MRKLALKVAILFVALALALVASVGAAPLPEPAWTIDVGNGLELACYQMGGSLPNTSNYDWWYGCSPTSAGMMMGHYDRNGYATRTYTNLVPGGVAEANSYGGGGGLDSDGDTSPDLLCNKTIASARHISDFYVGAYGASGDDVAGAPTGSLNCLADFMGTSQDAAGNTNGSTSFYGWLVGGNPSAYRYTADDAVAQGSTLRSGMYGVGEYVQYAGYDYVNPTTDPLNLSSPQTPGSRDDRLYNQFIDAVVSGGGGFSLADYRAEIDAGRGVLVHIENHTMFGYGYDPLNTNIFVYDTWNDLDGGGPYTDGQNPGVLPWGGTYQGAQHMSVTVLELKDGEQPADQDPVADPNGPYTLFLGYDLSLDGSGSSDPDGGAITNYLWSVGGGTYDAGTNATPTMTWAQLGSAFGITGYGTWSLSLTVTDDEQATASASTTLRVVAIPEPATMTLLGLSSLGLLASRRRRRRRAA